MLGWLTQIVPSGLIYSFPCCWKMSSSRPPSESFSANCQAEDCCLPQRLAPWGRAAWTWGPRREQVVFWCSCFKVGCGEGDSDLSSGAAFWRDSDLLPFWHSCHSSVHPLSKTSFGANLENISIVPEHNLSTQTITNNFLRKDLKQISLNHDMKLMVIEKMCTKDFLCFKL